MLPQHSLWAFSRDRPGGGRHTRDPKRCYEDRRILFLLTRASSCVVIVSFIYTPLLRQASIDAKRLHSRYKSLVWWFSAPRANELPILLAIKDAKYCLQLSVDSDGPWENFLSQIVELGWALPAT